MNLFINEWSFQGQFYSKQDFDCAVPPLLHLILQGKKVLAGGQGQMWRSHKLVEASALRTKPLVASLNNISDKEIREEFWLVLRDRVNPLPWEPGLHDSGDLYEWQGHDVSGTSMAELAERRLRDPQRPGCLLNLRGSSLDGHSCITVFKQSTLQSTMGSVGSLPELDKWLEGIRPKPYGPASSDPPRDDQTCLTDTQRFQPLVYEVQGRRCYRDRTRGDIYYVDNLHAGAAAHLEVFDKFRRHLGEADLQVKQLNRAKRDPKKDGKIGC